MRSRLPIASGYSLQIDGSFNHLKRVHFCAVLEVGIEDCHYSYFLARVLYTVLLARKCTSTRLVERLAVVVVTLSLSNLLIFLELAIVSMLINSIQYILRLALHSSCILNF